MGINISNCIDTKKIKEKIKTIVKTEINNIVEDVSKDLENVFNDAIDQYYLYRTRMYVRHGNEKPGKYGHNLYNAIVIDYKNGKKINLFIGWDANNLESYAESTISTKGNLSTIPGEKDPNVVLDMITSGERFNVGSWKFEPHSKYFNFHAKTLDGITEELNAWGSEVLENILVKNICKTIRKELY